MEIVEDSLDDLWIRAASYVLERGIKTNPRGMGTREITGMQLVLTNPRKRIPHLPVREFSLSYAMGELAWYVAGDDSLDFIKHYAPSYDKYSDDQKRLHGAYGPRIFGCNQHFSDRPDPNFHEMETELYNNPCRTAWQSCIDILKKDPDSRQAVIPIYRPADVGAVTKDMPCTLSLQFLIRNSQLNMVVNMRSNDLWFGGVYDIFCFTALQELMANALQLPLGVYYHHVGSFHIYDKNVADVERCIAEYRGPSIGLPPRIPIGNQGVDTRGVIEDLLHREVLIRTGEPVEMLEQLCSSVANMEGQPTLWQLAFAAWRWRIVSRSAIIKEEQRRYARGLLQDYFGLTFERCFF